MPNHTLQEILADYITLPEYIGFEKISVNTKSDFGDFPIHIASVRGDITAMKILLKHGADINAIGEHGYTSLHNAVGQGHFDMVKFLLSVNADKNIKNDNDKTPYELAEILAEKEIMYLLAE